MTTVMRPLWRIMVQAAVMTTWDVRSQNWRVGLPLPSYFSLSWGCAGYLRHAFRKIRRGAKHITKEPPSRTGSRSHLLKREGLIFFGNLMLCCFLSEKREVMKCP